MPAIDGYRGKAENVLRIWRKRKKKLLLLRPPTQDISLYNQKPCQGSKPALRRRLKAPLTLDIYYNVTILCCCSILCFWGCFPCCLCFLSARVWLPVGVLSVLGVRVGCLSRLCLSGGVAGCCVLSPLFWALCSFGVVARRLCLVALVALGGGGFAFLLRVLLLSVLLFRSFVSRLLLLSALVLAAGWWCRCGCLLARLRLSRLRRQ